MSKYGFICKIYIFQLGVYLVIAFFYFLLGWNVVFFYYLLLKVGDDRKWVVFQVYVNQMVIDRVLLKYILKNFDENNIFLLLEGDV